MDKLSKQSIQNVIDTYGHQLIGVFGEAKAATFTYSIGLSPKLGFELLCIGLPYKYVHTILNDIARDMANEQFEFGKDYTNWTNMPRRFRKCDYDLEDLHKDYVVQADHFHDKQVDVVQIVMPDRNGKFPEDVDFDVNHMGKIQRIFYKLHELKY